MLKAGDAALLYSSVAVNLLALRHEICAVLVIEDPRWYERESGALRICDEFLQQCEQAEARAFYHLDTARLARYGRESVLAAGSHEIRARPPRKFPR